MPRDVMEQMVANCLREADDEARRQLGLTPAGFDPAATVVYQTDTYSGRPVTVTATDCHPRTPPTPMEA